MFFDMPTWFVIVLDACAVGCLLALMIAFLRLVRGPSMADRVAALDLVGGIALALIVVFAVMARERAFLNAAMAIAVIAFLGTVALARYLEQEVPQ
ncbi:MAG: monovalent cation/H+ antiporter complex subunit F [Candidatus Krumholzibacteriia bacterium]